MSASSSVSLSFVSSLQFYNILMTKVTAYSHNFYDSSIAEGTFELRVKRFILVFAFPLEAL